MIVESYEYAKSLFSLVSRILTVPLVAAGPSGIILVVAVSLVVAPGQGQDVSLLCSDRLNSQSMKRLTSTAMKSSYFFELLGLARLAEESVSTTGDSTGSCNLSHLLLPFSLKSATVVERESRI